MKQSGDITGLARSPLGILAIAFVFVHGVVTIVAGTGSLEPGERMLLIGFAVVFPFVILGVFYRLVTHHHHKLYSPKDFTDETNFMRLADVMKQSNRATLDQAWGDSPSTSPSSTIQPFALSALNMIRAQVELYRVQHDDQYPDFAANGWDDLIDDDYLVEPPENPLSPDEPDDVRTKVIVRPGVTGKDVDPEEAGWVWNGDGPDDNLWLSGVDR